MLSRLAETPSTDWVAQARDVLAAPLHAAATVQAAGSAHNSAADSTQSLLALIQTILKHPAIRWNSVSVGQLNY